MVNPYLGNACLTLSATIFMILKANGFNVEMIIGDVSIKGTNLFYTTEKYLKKRSNEPQKLHAWVGLGDDCIIDFALPAKLHTEYDYFSKIKKNLLIMLSIIFMKKN